MKAYRINPYDRTVTEVEDDKGWRLEAMYDAMRRPDGTFSGIGSAALTPREYLWVDDEGLLVSGVPVFRIRGAEMPLAGIALCLGLDEAGDNAAPAYPIEAIQAAVIWTDEETTGELEPSRDEIQHHPVLGRIPVHIVGGPILRKRETAPEADEARDRLSAEFESWATSQGFHTGTADELLFRKDLTAAQRDWLQDFVERWSSNEDS